MTHDILVRLYGVPVTASERRLAGVPKEHVETVREVIPATSLLGKKLNVRG